tara:strand:- start:12435 stop:12728 length:294 start_codon:yes stop_codon:yes gene_type:complete
MKHWVIIIDKERKKLTKTSTKTVEDDMTDDGKYEDADFNVVNVPGTVSVNYHKSMERNIDYIENVTVTNTDISKVTISNSWDIKVVESGVPIHDVLS